MKPLSAALVASCLLACSEPKAPIELPAGLSSGAILVFFEDTRGDAPVVVAVYAAELDGKLSELQSLMNASLTTPEHYTVLHYNSGLTALGLSPGAQRAPVDQEGRRPVPRPEAGFRMRVEPDGYHTPWRDYPALEPPLSAWQLYATCVDRDGDGYGTYCAAGPDCDDSAADVNPGAAELCNDRDDDCNGAADDGFMKGQECFVPESGAPDCYRAGHAACAPDGVGLDCAADGSAERVCCPAGEQPGASSACCLSAPAPDCAFSCSIDLVAGTHDCSAPLRVESLAGQRATATLSLSGYSGVEVGIEACDPTGWTFHLADSPSCNGGGGDAGDRSNDAEVHVTNGDLFYWGNSTLPVEQIRLYTSNGYLPATGCTSRTLRFQDQRVRSLDPCFDVSSPFGLRLDPPADTEGPADAEWYLGLNTVVTRTSGRDGTGVRRATICVLR